MTRSRPVVLAVAAAFAALVLTLSAACGAQEGAGDGAAGLPPDAEAPGALAEGDELSVIAAGSEDSALRAENGDAFGVFSYESSGSPLPGAQLQSTVDHRIIQSSSVDVEVEEGEVGRSFQEIIRIAETNGGFVASSSFSNLDDLQIADLTIRVPGDRSRPSPPA